MTDPGLDRLPEGIRERVEESRARVEAILDEARSLLRTRLPGKVTLEPAASTPEPPLDRSDRAQAITLVQRYAQLPEAPDVEVGKRPDLFYVANLIQVRRALGDYRPFIHGSGSLHYARLHTTWSRRLSGSGGSARPCIRALDEAGREIPGDYGRWLNDRKKAIGHVIGEMDYGFVYDGILVHEKAAYSERFLREYESGELNHTLWAHLVPLGFIRQMLWPYQSLARAIGLPEPGGL